jgi:hypothetical protein
MIESLLTQVLFFFYVQEMNTHTHTHTRILSSITTWLASIIYLDHRALGKYHLKVLNVFIIYVYTRHIYVCIQLIQQ